MTTRGRAERWQRLGLMVLVPSLAVVGLAAQPPDPDEAPRPAVVQPRRPAATRTPAAATAAAPARPAVPDDPAPVRLEPIEWPAGEIVEAQSTPETGWPAEMAPLEPDVIVALEQPGSWSGLPLSGVPHAHAADEAQPVPQAVLDGAAGPGDGMEGFDPGARYWFGPQGLERMQVSMEAQR